MVIEIHDNGNGDYTVVFKPDDAAEVKRAAEAQNRYNKIVADIESDPVIKEMIDKIDVCLGGDWSTGSSHEVWKLLSQYEWKKKA